MSKLIDRAQAILLTPRTEWPVIAAEPETTAGLYKNYIAILAAIGPVAALLGTMLFLTALGFVFSSGFVFVLLMYAATLGGVYLFALIINARRRPEPLARDQRHGRGERPRRDREMGGHRAGARVGGGL